VHDTQLENDILNSVLDYHGITLSTRSSPSVPGNSIARVALSGPPGPNQCLQVQNPNSIGFRAPLPQAKGAINSYIATPVSSHAAVQDLGMVGHKDCASPTVRNRNLCQSLSPPASSTGSLDTESAGFQFVLTYERFFLCWFEHFILINLCRLERPCLHHTGHPSISSGMSGHALTLNAAALACAPSHIQPDEAWSVPTGSLERLLELSGRLGMELGKITPIQAWQRVREHPNFAILTPMRLQELIAQLSEEVKCHG
jgi:hypothetical protein